ncbi:MAG: ATP-binding protein [Planctomycetes bacterium]|nr:ATP-binding protein [Planctomycetota bacterium]
MSAATPEQLAVSRGLPLRRWAADLARRWNAGSQAVFVLHGDVFDLFPVPDEKGIGWAPLKAFLSRRLFPDRGTLLFYDISDGLTFGSRDMQTRFFEWLAVYDTVENTDFHRSGPPREFTKLAPLLRRFFLRASEEKGERRGVTLIIDFPEKIVPATEESGASADERISLVTILKWATSYDVRALDVAVILVTESAAELHADLLQNPHVAQVAIDLPDEEDRRRFIESKFVADVAGGRPLAEWCDLSAEDLARRTAGLALVRVQNLIAEAVRNGGRVTGDYVSQAKRRLIEDYCQGMVRFKDPKPGLTLDRVATHTAAKARMRELAWLLRNGKTDVVERGVLLPGRVGVGKSFLVDCFASECGLPVLEMGEFRSKWVGDTERQQMRILMTIRALGPVVVVVDEADAVLGTRQADGDSGVSSRVFAAFAAHIGDSTLRGRELWIAMTSRPDLLSIDMKRQGRFGLCVPLFPAQGPDDVLDLVRVIAKTKSLALDETELAWARDEMGTRPLTGSDVDAILTRAKERAVLALRDDDVRVEDLRDAVASFIDPLDGDLLLLQELAAVLACSDRRFLPEAYRDADRTELAARFAILKMRAGAR